MDLRLLTPSSVYAGITTTTAAEVEQFYSAIDYGPPPTLDAGTLANYESMGPAQVINAMENSAYTLNVVDAVFREYLVAFGRAPDAAGAAYWTHELGSGEISLAQLSTVFANSPEFKALYGVNASTPATTQAIAPVSGLGLISTLYLVALSQTPDAPGHAYWTNSGLNAGQLLEAFSQAQGAVKLFQAEIINYQNETPTVGQLVHVGDTHVLF